jgi:hypothetical protein
LVQAKIKHEWVFSVGTWDCNFYLMKWLLSALSKGHRDTLGSDVNQEGWENGGGDGEKERFLNVKLYLLAL